MATLAMSGKRSQRGPMPLIQNHNGISMLGLLLIAVLSPVTAQLSSIRPTTTAPSSTLSALVRSSASSNGSDPTTTSSLFSATPSNTAFRSVPTDVAGDDDDPPDK